MHNRVKFREKPASFSIRNCFERFVPAGIIVSLLTCAAHNALAADVTDLGVVGATDTGAAVQQNSPTYQAPTQGSLDATQPQSIINQHYIQENASAGSNYTDIVNIAPSVFSVDPNGPGMMETQSLTMRGFQDGQYNVTFDGIPWGDSNDFTHHSTSYFMSQDMGNIVIDRGPGDASNIGNATFGGTIAINSKDLMTAPTFTPYATFGSFNTVLAGAEFDTGVMKNYGDTSAMIDYKNFTSDGYLTNSNIRRSNLFLKFIKPMSDNTSISFVTMQNQVHQNVPLGATLANIEKYGQNYGLSSDPTSQNYYGYNYDDIKSDFEYLGLNSVRGNLKVDNKLYTYAYYHNGFNGADPGGALPNGTTYGASNVPGQKMDMNYRSWGDLLRLTNELASGNLEYGAWVDYQTNNRMQLEVDYTIGGGINPAGGGVNGIDRSMTNTLTTIQPYLQYEWKVSDALTVTPGVKYSSFTRTIDAAVNQGTNTPYSSSDTWAKALPALSAHYKIQSNWTAYAQFAEGFLAPNMNIYFKPNVQPSTLQPQSTKNFQLGTTWAGSRLNVSGDIYRIDFNNQITSTPCGIYTCFNNAGGVKYDGVEGEATYFLGTGFSLYGNYALNNYSTSDGSLLLNVPRNTASAGLIYNRGASYASLIAKEVGTRYSGQDINGNPIPFSSFTVTNFSYSYTLGSVGNWGKAAKIGFQVNNVFDKNGIFASFANDASGNPMFYVIPERNYELSLSVSM
jgi:iron complex outermembrane receptor protein